MNDEKSISVIVRLRNEERWIGHAIQSILDFLYKPEIIVINNNSSDDSIQIVKRFSEDKNLKDNNSRNYTDINVINIDEYTPGKSINLGVKNAKNDYILVMSAHCVLKKIDLGKLINNLEKYVAIFGNQIPIWEGKKIVKRYLWSHFKNDEVVNMFSENENRYFFHNAISFFKKEFLLANIFDEQIQSKEDRYWAADMINKNHKILYDPSLEVEHHYTKNGATWKGLG